MKLHLLVTLTVLGFVLFSGQALAAENSGLSLIEQTIQSSTERGLSTATMADRTAVRDVRSYFGSHNYDVRDAVESSKENGGGPATHVESDAGRDTRAYFGGAAEKDALNIWQTIESSKEKGLN